MYEEEENIRIEFHLADGVIEYSFKLNDRVSEVAKVYEGSVSNFETAIFVIEPVSRVGGDDDNNESSQDCRFPNDSPKKLSELELEPGKAYKCIVSKKYKKKKKKKKKKKRYSDDEDFPKKKKISNFTCSNCGEGDLRKEDFLGEELVILLEEKENDECVCAFCEFQIHNSDMFVTREVFSEVSKFVQSKIKIPSFSEVEEKMRFEKKEKKILEKKKKKAAMKKKKEAEKKKEEARKKQEMMKNNKDSYFPCDEELEKKKKQQEKIKKKKKEEMCRKKEMELKKKEIEKKKITMEWKRRKMAMAKKKEEEKKKAIELKRKKKAEERKRKKVNEEKTSLCHNIVYNLTKSQVIEYLEVIEAYERKFQRKMIRKRREKTLEEEKKKKKSEEIKKEKRSRKKEEKS